MHAHNFVSILLSDGSAQTVHTLYFCVPASNIIVESVLPITASASATSGAAKNIYTRAAIIEHEPDNIIAILSLCVNTIIAESITKEIKRALYSIVIAMFLF